MKEQVATFSHRCVCLFDKLKDNNGWAASLMFTGVTAKKIVKPHVVSVYYKWKPFSDSLMLLIDVNILCYY